MIDTQHLSTHHVEQVRDAVHREGLDDKVLFWP